MMKIAICDDEIQDIMNLRQSIQEHSDTHEIIEFLCADVFLKQIFSGEQFDLVFLDIQMPNADGWEISKVLKQAKQKIFIAMVTVYSEFIYDCFDRVDWFAPKPVSREKVFQILDIAEERLFPKSFSFKIDNFEITLSVSEIIYFEVQRNSLFIHTNSKCYKIRQSLKKVIEVLAECPQFVQTHSSFVINIDYYDCIKGSYIILKNYGEIELSRTFRNSFFESLSEYVRSGY